jgi:8-hydroxy-5-deazaflavin:NADPH oxidoreductase
VRVAVLGTGMVGRALSGKLAALGHETWIGTRDVEAAMGSTEAARDGSGTFSEWLSGNDAVRAATFAEAAEAAEVVFNATSGMASLDALGLAGAENLSGKILVDVSNPLDFSRGMPPSLSVCNTDSLAEQIQATFPDARVVKSLNTVTAGLMVDPGRVAGGEHAVFVASDDADAKATVTGILRDGFGWKHVVDLGGITAARGMEMYLPLWLGMMGALQTPMFNIAVVR